MKSKQVLKDHFNGNINLNNKYSRDELIVLWGLTFFDNITTYKHVGNQLKFLHNSNKVLCWKLGLSANFSIKLHGMMCDFNNQVKYVFNINGAFYCDETQIFYCTESNQYYSDYNGVKIFNDTEYLVCYKSKYFNGCNLVNRHKLLIERGTFIKFNGGISTPSFFGQTTMMVFNKPPNFDIDYARKMILSPNLFKKIYSKYHIKPCQ